MSRLTRHPGRIAPRPAGRRGVTLLEVLLSIAVMGVLLAATVSMMFVAQRAVAGNAETADRLAQQARASQMINLDLSLATSFSERTDRSATMVVPDRDGDGQPETIRYAWSGVAGDPLTRQVDGGPAVVLAANVHHFRLTYLLKTLQAAGG